MATKNSTSNAPAAAAGQTTEQLTQQRDFQCEQFAERECRRTSRLVRAAYSVGATHAWFRAAPRGKQVEKVREWVAECLAHSAERLAQNEPLA
jgi:hypothetical protein